MTEYIDRNLIEWYGCNFEEPSCKNRECSGCSHAECSHSQVMQIPPADVIEREKYEKALEEIENLGYISEKNDSLCNDLAQAFNKIDELKKGIKKAIEEMEIEYNNLTYTENHNLGASYGIRKSIGILERNIGE